MTFPVTTFPWEILYNKDRRGFHPSVPTDNMTRRKCIQKRNCIVVENAPLGIRAARMNIAKARNPAAIMSLCCSRDNTTDSP